MLGLITLENLLEELFGEIRDEFDYEGPEITLVASGEWLVSGAVEIDRLREALGDGKSLGVSGQQTFEQRAILRRLDGGCRGPVRSSSSATSRARSNACAVRRSRS